MCKVWQHVSRFTPIIVALPNPQTGEPPIVGYPRLLIPQPPYLREPAQLRLRAGRSGGRILSGAREPEPSDRLWNLPSLLFISFLGAKRLGREVDQSPPPSAKC
jgi:hypothetical protein